MSLGNMTVKAKLTAAFRCLVAIVLVSAPADREAEKAAVTKVHEKWAQVLPSSRTRSRRQRA